MLNNETKGKEEKKGRIRSTNIYLPSLHLINRRDSTSSHRCLKTPSIFNPLHTIIHHIPIINHYSSSNENSKGDSISSKQNFKNLPNYYNSFNSKESEKSNSSCYVNTYNHYRVKGGKLPEDKWWENRALKLISGRR